MLPCQTISLVHCDIRAFLSNDQTMKPLDIQRVWFEATEAKRTACICLDKYTREKKKKKKKATLCKLLYNSENLSIIPSISTVLVTNLHIDINNFELCQCQHLFYYLKTFIILNLKDKIWDLHWNIFHV